MNRRHKALQASALPTELQDRLRYYTTYSQSVLKLLYMKRINTSPISGMQELLPSSQAVFDSAKHSLAQTFKAHGFQHIETPIIDRTDILLAKAGGDTEKQIYKVVKTAETADDADQALRFDHTVPLARYVVEHENDLAFPFKVTQIGRNFRGERAQKGRFRELYQCDADVIGRGTLPIAYDAEVIATLYYALTSAFDLPPVLMRISNRKILTGLLNALNLNNLSQEIFNIIDHVEKVTPEVTKESLEELNIGSEDVVKITTFADIHGSKSEIEKKLQTLGGIDDATFREGIKELLEVLELLEQQGLKDHYVADMRIVRGLDYYTGTVFEYILPDYANIGSICGGGRYENLASNFTDQVLPGVGGSIGLTRLFYILGANNLIKETAEAPIDIAIIPLSTNEYNYAHQVADELREQGKSVDIIFTDKKLGDKFKYASKIAKQAIVIGEEEAKTKKYEVKDLF